MMADCRICHVREDTPGVVLHRVNAVGVEGIWECAEHYTGDVDPVIQDIINAIQEAPMADFGRALDPPVYGLAPQDISAEELAALMDLPPPTYQQRVLALFRSGRATAAQWQAMAEAVWEVSQSSEGILVASIDRAVLREGGAPYGATH